MHKHTLGFLAFPVTQCPQIAEPHPQQGGGRERQKHASPGKGETHWKSRLGVSVSTVTGESLHVYHPASGKQPTAQSEPMSQAELGDPSHRDPYWPSHRADKERVPSDV